MKANLIPNCNDSWLFRQLGIREGSNIISAINAKNLKMGRQPKGFKNEEGIIKI